MGNKPNTISTINIEHHQIPTVFYPISTPEDYIVNNGFLGMMRDVIFKLLETMRFNEKNLKSLLGMCQEIYIWKTHYFFLEIRNNLFSFHDRVIQVTNTGRRLVWQSRFRNTFFVDIKMTKGLYKITIEGCNNTNYINIEFGLAEKRLLHTLTTTLLSSHSSGTCAIDNSGIDCGRNRQITYNFFRYQYNVALSLEFDRDRHILYFFINKRRTPYCIIQVPSSVHFAVSGTDEGTIIEVRSVERLTTPTIDVSLHCTKYKWI